MEQDLNLETLDTIEANAEKNLQVKNRFEQLSEKVIVTAKERDDATARFKAEAENRSKAEKERDFYKDFSQVSSQHPSAVAFQEQILEKVNKGYSTEDATLAVLAKEGKLGGSPQQVTFQSSNPAGGSAATAMSDTGGKTLKEMTREEKRNALNDALNDGSNIFQI